ncbi:hypothetical protein [Terriglobus sp.]|uniref:hypothetical protein n=1 Tax=Terriglobus sp. TaxID=1889013 RepID=UPI003B0063E1
MFRLALFALALPLVALGQAAPNPSTTQGPTTKVLAIGHLTGAPSPALRSAMPDEIRQTVQLYLNGKIDQWFARKDQNGVVFLMNVTSVDEAHKLLEALPLGVSKQMEFELIPLGPLTPLRFLMTPPSSPAPSGSQQ